jgi:hypothetical protein
VSLRSRLRCVEKSAHVDMIVVPQPDGSIKRFHPDAPLVEYSRCCGRMLRFTLDIGGAALER